MKNNIPSVKELMNMHDTLLLFLKEAGFGEVFHRNPDNLKEVQVNQFALAVYTPALIRMIGTYKGE